MDRDDGPHADGTGASHERPPQVPLEGGQRGQGHSIAGGPRLTLPQATEEEQTAIWAMLNKRAASAPAGARIGHAAALVLAGIKLAAVVLLTAGVKVGLGDGNVFDDVGCTVAQQPGGTSHGARSAQNREGAGGKVPGSDGGSAGPSGTGGAGGRPECETRAENCANRMADGLCRISRRTCRLLGMQNAEGRMRKWPGCWGRHQTTLRRCLRCLPAVLLRQWLRAPFA